jgi:hypothetical protein
VRMGHAAAADQCNVDGVHGGIMASACQMGKRSTSGAEIALQEAWSSIWHAWQDRQSGEDTWATDEHRWTRMDGLPPLGYMPIRKMSQMSQNVPSTPLGHGASVPKHCRLKTAIEKVGWVYSPTVGRRSKASGGRVHPPYALNRQPSQHLVKAARNGGARVYRSIVAWAAFVNTKNYIKYIKHSLP